MNFNRSIKGKIQIYILGSVIIVYLIVLGFISFSNRKASYNQTTKIIGSYADRYALEISARLNSDMAVVRTLSSVFKIDSLYERQQFMSLKNAIIYDVFLGNPDVYSYWDSWEYSYIKPGWDKPYGRTAFTIWNEKGTVKHTVDERSLEGDGELYAKQKLLMKENAFEPYMDQYTAGKAEAQMMSSLSVPIVRNGKFAGIIAEDLTLNQFHELLNGIKPFDDANAVLVSQSGTIAGYPDKKMLNKSITELIGKKGGSLEMQVLDSIKKGETFSFIAKDSTGVDTYYAFSPIAIGRDGVTTWSLGVSVPVSTIYAQTNRSFIVTLLVGLLGLIVIWIVNSLLSNSITRNITRITGLLNRMSRGEMSEELKVDIETRDEIGEMGLAINKTLDSLLEKENFANQIGKGNLDVELNLISEDDILGKSLIGMRNDLKRAKEEEIARKQVDDRLRWSAETLGKLNDIIRNNNHDITLLCNTLIKEIVYAVKANQGGIFLLNEEDDEVSYELISAFAYNRHKLMKRRFVPGEGVIGACIAEKEMIYLTEIPDEYVEITSGLGGANPRNIFIVPFVHDGKVLGVVEVASFTLFADDERELIVKIAENFASAISFAKSSSVTQHLLEQSKLQAEMMSAQEEEMRQNMEELRSTQEESQRQQNELISLINALGNAVLWTEYDLKGNVINVSDRLVGKSGVVKEKLLASNAHDDYAAGGNEKNGFTPLWNSILDGKVQKVFCKRKLGIDSRSMVDTYSVVNIDNQAAKIIRVSVDITEYLN